MSIIKDAFETHALKPRPEFHRGRELTVGSSEIGQCIRKVGYSKHPHWAERNPDAERWGASMRGRIIETRFFLPALRKAFGDKLLLAGIDQRRLTLGTLSATPDGLLIKQPRDLLTDLGVPDIGPSQCVVVEAKSIDPRVGLQEAKPVNVFQTIVQMGLLRAQTKHAPDYAIIIYFNASFLDDVVEFAVKYDEAVFQQAQVRADRIMRAESASDLRPEGWVAGGKECEYCPWSRACAKLRGDVVESKVEPDPQFVAEIVDLARQERLLKARCSSADTDHRDMVEKIKSRLRDKGLRKIKADDTSVSWSAVKGRPSYDWSGIKAACEAAGIDLHRFETAGEPTDRLNVSVVSKDRLIKPKTFPSV